ncbi:hybrid sensor histidine kinase/response regulator transcription factor [Flavilitoribacter nigricans]|uniref:histidine kinase n=1 Tax=Flavilitoribacter nigricans (strain ATCC 23147 / DSM 23189 / NBRC 102662 / NCIMB 1420 / SS-2) TaxID=1122177 RepID=A0A2D0MZN1_FLAN2|nr:ATP-binding protein [Flavilitoribacter nigricans]PHN01588.1 hypothetical protein CRP01_36425 [Flavilitoribacter nigricans DSM 23189 = NBRC 102662]
MSFSAKKFVEWGHHPDDPQDEKLKKSSLLVVSGPFALAGLIWGVLYFSNGLLIPGAIPFTYGVLSIINIISFGFSKQYVFFRNSQLVLILILPFALQVSLGGFVPSSAVIYWAIIAPAGAMFFDSIKRSVYWFGAYLALCVIAYLINDLIPEYVNWDLSESFVNGLFLMNIIGVSCIVFGILYYFVSTITKLNEDIEKKNEVLHEQSIQLREMDEIKSRFFANISHEFRTPLTLILGLVKKQVAHPERPPDLRDSDTMLRNARRLLQLINQLLDLSKLESGEAKLQAVPDDIVLFVKNATAQFESMALDKGLSLTFNGRHLEEPVDIPPIEIYFDHSKMHKVLNNLLSNAIKFTRAGERVAVELEQLRDTDQDREVVVVRVINTGTEIPAEKLPKVFDRFYQVDGASNREYEGTGIGLALVKELVEMHHGQVSVSSKMQKTCFSISLPVGDDYLGEEEIVRTPMADSEEELPELIPGAGAPIANTLLDEGENDAPDTGRLEILIVEDNSDLRSFIKGILEPEFQVIEAVDGLDGFEKAGAAIPDLIVSDVMMPRMDGYELCKQLKTDDRTNHIPVILLTAKAARENKLEGLGQGADDYLIKPFDEKELTVRIRNLIDLRKKLQQKYQQDFSLQADAVPVPTVPNKFLESLRAVVEANIDNEQFGVEEVQREIGMSRSQIHRKLKALTGQSLTTFIRNYRLHRAAELLKQDVGNITEIAFEVGFNSQTYFSSSFQELFGCSPSEFKKNHS